jgi:hypothetical protein
MHSGPPQSTPVSAPFCIVSLHDGIGATQPRHSEKMPWVGDVMLKTQTCSPIVAPPSHAQGFTSFCTQGSPEGTAMPPMPPAPPMPPMPPELGTPAAPPTPPVLGISAADPGEPVIG